ncbi:MAG: nucleoside hydrolase [Solirubrobacterales bacterium]
MTPRPIIVDSDPGVDDAVALALIAASPELEPLAVTTLAGNGPVEQSFRNAAGILGELGWTDVPVAVGAHRPLIRTAVGHTTMHGPNGIGGVQLPPLSDIDLDRAPPAIDLLAEILSSASPGSVTIVELGPMTNLALFAALHPELLDRIDKVVAMGGNLRVGNVTPEAEFNVWFDPEAAHRVMVESGLNVEILTLGATYSSAIFEPQRGALAACSAIGELLAEMISGYLEEIPDEGWVLHDALVIAHLLAPEIVELRNGSVAVDTGTRLTRGRCTFAFNDAGTGSLQVGVAADSAAFRELLIDRVGRLDGKSAR